MNSDTKDEALLSFGKKANSTRAVFQTAAVALAKAVHERFFIGVMEPQLMQT